MRIFRPRSTAGLAFRFFLLAVLVTGSVAATAAVAGLLQVQTLVADISFNPPIKAQGIKVPAAGAPETILLIGSDHRPGEPFKDANTDTMLLVRLNGSSSTINVMSLPRDLEVDIPDHGTFKLNSAYTDGGWGLLIKTIRSNVFPQFVPNHIIDVNFRGFSDLVDAIGCVYSDVDRRYYNQSSEINNYASINIQPGYQKLCGGNNKSNGALSFVRYRHTDSDITREARQQDFIRWTKSQYSIGRMLANRNHLLKIFGRHSQSDAGLQSTSGLLKLFELAANMEGHGATVKQIPFPADIQTDCGGIDPTTGEIVPCYVTSTPDAERQAWARFIKPTPPAAHKSTRAAARHRAPAKPSSKGLSSDRADGRAQAAALKHAKLPVFYPRLIAAGTEYCSGQSGNCDIEDEPQAAFAHSYPRAYRINGRAGNRYHAYRMTLTVTDAIGEYYGVQGTTWNDPPLLSSPSGTTLLHGRKLFLYKDGHKLTQVAWHRDGDAYWISNTLTENLTNGQMLQIAASLTRAAR